ncbi:P-loop NTPase fold protein [Mesorhizobium argentiipisi]|uniref:KAP NTPase domain-containing protein n=1 Tax=Mesorhizobium argentiipisi TaxID=3015175 RepID=A0ABU8KMD5_9HYPH
MSTDLVKNQIEEFLRTAKPEVMCIRGNWGTGKTYNWQTAIKSLRDDPEAVKLNQYAYVSLFGVSSVNQIKAAILQNTVTRDMIGDLITSESIKSTLQKGERGFKAGLMKLLPIGGERIFDAVVSALSLLSNKQIICFDDLERKAAGLSAGDVLGFMSYLKEQRECKVVLLLNDEALKGEDKDQFTSYLEKVVDINLRFSPSAWESAKIALDGVEGGEDLKALVGERAIKLGIDNVRVIRKIFRLVALIAPLLKAYKPGVLKSVVNSIVLFGWCHYQPELAPAIEFVRKRGAYETIADSNQKAPNPVEADWVKKLHDYGYGYTDDFDLVLMQGVADGYFKQESVDAHAAKLHQREEASEARRELDAAWDKYHYSFRDTQDEVLDGLYSCFMKNVKFYNLGTVIGLVDLFRELGDARSEEMFERFAEIHKDIPDIFDVSSMYRFGQEIPDDLKERVAELHKGAKPKWSVDQLFLELERNGFHSEIGDRLAEVPVDEYVRVLTTYEGEELMSIRRGLTADLNVTNPGRASVKVMERAAEALSIIGKENPFNARRTRMWKLIQWVDTIKTGAIRIDGQEGIEAAASAQSEHAQITQPNSA